MILKPWALNCPTTGSRSSFHRAFDRLPLYVRDEQACVGNAAAVARSRNSNPRRAGRSRPTLREPSHGSPARTVRRTTHAHPPWALVRWIPTNASAPATRGLCYREGQTFGIEFELAPKHGEIPSEDSAEWLRVANAIADALKHRLPSGSFGAVHAEYVGSERSAKSPSHWNVEYDDTTGWEVTTRVLTGVEGFHEVEVGCRALAQVAAEHDLCVDARTGTHVHFGWSGDIQQLKRTVELVKLFEPALGSLVAPSRIARLTDGRYDLDAPNPYSRPVSTVLSAEAMRDLRLFSELTSLTAGDDDLRYVTFNVRPLDHQQTVEVRMHHGTLEPHKILRWVSLWQQILWAAENPRRELEPTPDVHVITPTADLVSLAREYLVPLEQPGQREFLALLQQDRRDILERSWKPQAELARWITAR